MTGFNNLDNHETLTVKRAA